MSDYSILEAALDLTCPHCGAKAGKQCKTRTGRPTGQPHSRRTDPLAYAYGAGYDEGLRVGQLRTRRVAGEQR